MKHWEVVKILDGQWSIRNDGQEVKVIDLDQRSAKTPDDRQRRIAREITELLNAVSPGG